MLTTAYRVYALCLLLCNRLRNLAVILPYLLNESEFALVAYAQISLWAFGETDTHPYR